MRKNNNIRQKYNIYSFFKVPEQHMFKITFFSHPFNVDNAFFFLVNRHRYSLYGGTISKVNSKILPLTRAKYLFQIVALRSASKSKALFIFIADVKRLYVSLSTRFSIHQKLRDQKFFEQAPEYAATNTLI